MRKLLPVMIVNTLQMEIQILGDQRWKSPTSLIVLGMVVALVVSMICSIKVLPLVMVVCI